MHSITKKRLVNSLYCTNRTSLGNSFYAKRYSIYTCTDRNYQKMGEGHGMPWNAVEAYGNIWKPLENARIFHSIVK